MQEARPKPRQVATPFCRARHGESTAELLVLGVHLDIAEHREVIAGFDACQVCFEISGERIVAGGGLRQFGGVNFVGEEFDADLRRPVFQRAGIP